MSEIHNSGTVCICWYCKDLVIIYSALDEQYESRSSSSSSRIGGGSSSSSGGGGSSNSGGGSSSNSGGGSSSNSSSSSSSSGGGGSSSSSSSSSGFTDAPVEYSLLAFRSHILFCYLRKRTCVPVKR